MKEDTKYEKENSTAGKEYHNMFLTMGSITFFNNRITDYDRYSDQREFYQWILNDLSQS